MERKETLENFGKQGPGGQQILWGKIRGGRKRHWELSFFLWDFLTRKDIRMSEICQQTSRFDLQSEKIIAIS
jgi:hypothetical protein